MVFKCSKILERCIVEKKSSPLTHERSSVGARPSSAAPIDQKPQPPNTRTLFCRSAAVLGRPRRTHASRLPIEAALHSFARVLLEGGDRGLTRSDRRAFVCSGR